MNQGIGEMGGATSQELQQRELEQQLQTSIICWRSVNGVSAGNTVNH